MTASEPRAEARGSQGADVATVEARPGRAPVGHRDADGVPRSRLCLESPREPALGAGLASTIPEASAAPAFKPGSRKHRRGVALILVLGAIAVLTVLLTEFQDEASAETAAAINERDALKAEYMARSAINLSRLLIAAEPTVGRALSLFFMGQKPPQVPLWEFSDQILGAFNGPEGAQGFAALTSTDFSTGENLGMEGGTFEVMIVDEDAKLNANLAARGDAISQNRLGLQLLALMAGDQYNPLFEERDRDGQHSDRQAICSAIVDWADPDENLYPCDPYSATPIGVMPEDASYQLLKTPYHRKNAAYDSLDELRLVRGVGDDFFATFIDPEPENPQKRVMTVWGQGAVNVNTANAQTLLSIICANSRTAKICLDPFEAQGFLTAVTLIRGFTAGAPLFKSPKDFIATMQGKGIFGPVLTALGLEPVVFESENETQKMIATESRVFSIYADGIVSGFQRQTKVRVHAVVDFRDAPPPGMPLLPNDVGGVGGLVGPGGTQPLGGMSGGVGGIQGNLPPDAGPDAIGGALAPNPGGTIIYWRMD